MQSAHRRLLLTTICLAIALPGVAAPRGKQRIDADALSKRSEKVYDALKTYAQVAKGSLEIGDNVTSVKALIRQKSQVGRPNRFRIETSIDFMGKEQQSHIISDGTTVWHFDPDSLQYTEEKCAELFKTAERRTDWLVEHTGGDISLAIFFPGEKKKPHKEEFRVKSAVRKVIDGRPTYVVELVDKPGATKTGNVTIYLDAKDLFLRRVRMTPPISKEERNAKLKVLMTFFYSDIKANPSLEQDVFIFTPPEGAMKVDSLPSVMKRTFNEGGGPRTDT